MVLNTTSQDVPNPEKAIMFSSATLLQLNSNLGMYEVRVDPDVREGHLRAKSPSPAKCLMQALLKYTSFHPRPTPAPVPTY